MIHVGIDWSDKSHYFCILSDKGERLDSFQVSHGQDGFEVAHKRISKHASTPSEVRVAIETKDSLLVDYLSELGYTLYFLNPKQTDRFRDRHRMSKSKSDSFDAFVLADAVRTDSHLFNALSPLDEASLRLRVLTRAREGLVNRKVAVQNEITAYLKRYFPAALDLFGGIDNAEAIGFLLQYPTHEQASTVSETRIASILKKHGGVSEAIATRHAAKAHAKLSESYPPPSASIARAYPLAVKSLLRQLKDILDEMEALDNEIKCVYEDHPDKTLAESLPGIAETLGPVFVGEIGQDVETRFADLKTLKAFGGTSPVTGQSGKYREVHFRRACNTHLRRALHLASQAAIIRCGWARELYDRLRSQGKSYGRALRAVADQLLEILYVILIRRTPYNEAYHLQMKALHGRA
ncbi:MAG: IS110 family transposase [Armatimonadetes bacterium]|nr:IS110 family transposase [Armatimonadota bacterium]